ncbi:MAG: histidine phosphatase family protein [Gammaproteobacteria bacterium]|nr:histidine phosphatase family protein [Gammaproteobacteria bacterium]
MSRLYLVRHGQAAFGTDDYDRLTETGIAQCRQLARHWGAIGRHVDVIYSGTLRRHRESAEAFVRATADAGGLPRQVQIRPGFEEYDYLALLAAQDGAGSVPDTLEDHRVFDRRLSTALGAWAQGELRGVVPYPVFRDRCAAALATLMVDAGRGRSAVLFGSAGSLAAAIQPVLGLADRELLRLKLTFFNTGVSSLLFDGDTVTIESLNSVSHLEQPAFTQLITHR